MRQSNSSLGLEKGSGRGTYVVAGEVVDRRLGQHGVVFQFRLPQGRSVASDDDKLGLACAQALECRLVAKSDPKQSVRREELRRRGSEYVLARLHNKRKARVNGVGGSLVLLWGHRYA